MKIVIEIDDKNYMSCQTSEYAKKSIYVDLVYAIRKGIILPKGHGRLVDADALEVSMADDWHTGNEIANCIKSAPTIIEADNVESEE